MPGLYRWFDPRKEVIASLATIMRAPITSQMCMLRFVPCAPSLHPQLILLLLFLMFVPIAPALLKLLPAPGMIMSKPFKIGTTVLETNKKF